MLGVCNVSNICCNQSCIEYGAYLSLRTISGKHDEAMKCKCDKRSSGLKEEPSGVICQEVGSSKPVVKTPTFIAEDYKGALDRALSFMIEFTDILLQVAKHRV